MKTIFTTVLLSWLIASANPVGAQEFPEEYLGLPGDNLNLYAVMKLFQESETLEAFERKLNDENSRINNLDLNGDNFVDYIMVMDYVDNNVHNIVLRVALSQNEYQDVAVFTVERLRNGTVHVQLIGDEALYGRNYIIEPYYTADGETPNPAYIGGKNYLRRAQTNRTVSVEIYTWPIIRYIYHPGYVVWRSTWYWGYEPYWWNPWRPFYWHYYYGYHYHWKPYYNRYYRVCNHFSYTRYHSFYVTQVKTYSPQVTYRINKGYYKNTYSRPEMKKEGEALFARNHPERYSRSKSNVVERDSRRSTGTNAARETNLSGSESVNSRNNSTINDRQTTNNRAGQNTVESRRNTSTTVDRSTTVQVRQDHEGQPSGITNSESFRTNATGRTRESSGVTGRMTEAPRTEQNQQVITRQPAQINNSRSIGNPSSAQRSNPSDRQGSSNDTRYNQPSSAQRNDAVISNAPAASNRQGQSAGQQRSVTPQREMNVVTKSASQSQSAARIQSNRQGAGTSSPAVRSSGNQNRSASSTPSVRSSQSQGRSSAPSASGRNNSSSSSQRSNSSRESSSSGGSRR